MAPSDLSTASEAVNFQGVCQAIPTVFASPEQ